MTVLEEFIIFLKESVPQMTDYYRSISKEVPNQAFSKLVDLIKKIKIEIVNQSQSVQSIIDVEELDKLEAALACLYSIMNLPKWLRATRGSLSIYSTGTEKFMLAHGDGAAPWMNALPVSFFLSNDLEEVEYNLDPGKQIIKQTSASGINQPLDSIVDFADTSNKAGSDLMHGFEFDDVVDDLKYVHGFDCASQQIQNMINLVEGDLMAYPDLSLSFKAIVGSNRNMVNLPVVFRQLDALVATDDYFLNFYINDAKIIEDSVVMDVLFPTVDGHQITQLIQ